MSKSIICVVTDCAKKAVRRQMCGVHYRRKLRHGDPLFTLRPDNGNRLPFLRDAAKSRTNLCIIWPFKSTSGGYGVLNISGRTVHASRAVLILSSGVELPLDAAHTCHNRLCVNPNHLRWATRSDNLSDKLADGTSNRGSSHPNAKLTEIDIKKIREDSRSNRIIAADYGVSGSHIGLIKRGGTWEWLDHVDL